VGNNGVNPMRYNILFFTLIVACICLQNAARAIPFTYNEKANRIILTIAGKEVSVFSEDFQYILDWSDDYTRSNKGTAKLCNGSEIVFSGAINPDQSIVFIYNINTRNIDSIANVTKLIVDEKWGWAVTKELPTYSAAAESRQVFVIVNGKMVTEVSRDDLQGIKWDTSSGDFILSIKNPKKTGWKGGIQDLPKKGPND
jgi:hypothetical protein